MDALDAFSLRPVARVRTDLKQKFGVPRQSGLVPALTGRVIFEPAFRAPDSVRGLEGYSHLWLIWLFHKAMREDWRATVRPPRLGGNERVGVFATRSPFRPNPIGLSCVALERVELSPGHGPILHISGVDLMDNTPVLDIKPYLPAFDARPDALAGFADAVAFPRLFVAFPQELLMLVPQEKRRALLDILANDPRPAYQNDPARVYGFDYAGLEVGFTVAGQELTVVRVERA